MRTIAIVSHKGGTSKTTIAVNLAAALAEAGAAVLLVDLDPQGSATQWVNLEPSENLIDALMGEAALAPVAAFGCSVVPCSRRLRVADRELAGEPGAESMLRDALKAWTGRRSHAYCLLDCPPALGILSLNAIVAATEILVPVEPTPLSASGAAALMETQRKVASRFLLPMQRVRLVLSPYRANTRLGEAVKGALRSSYDVLRTVIPETVRLAECPARHLPITAVKHGASVAFRALAKEIAR